MAIPYLPKFMAAAADASAVSALPAPPIFTQDDFKKAAAYKAVEFVHSGMVLGLGTGSTAKHAVDLIGELLRQGKLKDILGIPTSKKTHEQALSLGIPLSDLDSHPVIDLAIDGADEVDPVFNLVKGRGGSLLREKMVESVCKKFIVIVDESKLVDFIGGSGLAMPVEVVPYCWKFTAVRLRSLFEDSGCVAELRTVEDGEPYVTDNENYIVDLYFDKDIGDLKVASDRILRLAGVVEHEAAIDSRRQSMEATSSSTDDLNRGMSSPEMVFEDIPSSKKMVECRICQDEDEDWNMEAPCSCRGSLKYAHRKCIQKWCNEKGDTICEICLQQFKSGYTAPPPLFEMGRFPMNFRGNWETSRRDLDSPSYISMVSSNRNVADSNYDEFAVSAASSVLCCHSVAITVMVLLVLRHTLPLLFNETGDYSFPLLLSICLRTFGIFLPMYVMFKVVTAVHRRRIPLAASSSSPISSSGIARSSTSQSSQPQPYVIRVR